MEEEMTQEIDMTKPQPWEPLPLLRYNPPSVKSMLTVVEFVMEMINDGRDCMEEIVYGAKEDWANYEKIAEKLVWVTTEAATALHCLGYDLAARRELQQRLNEKNREVGYCWVNECPERPGDKGAC